MSGCTITGSGIGIRTDDSSGTYKDNVITGNSNYGMNNLSSSFIDAINNYWGDPSGPLDNSDDRASGGLYNPDGQGDRVSDRVNYYPMGRCDAYQLLQLLYQVVQRLQRYKLLQQLQPRLLW